MLSDVVLLIVGLVLPVRGGSWFVVAAVRGTPSLAVGNAIGSCVCNIGLVLGVTAVIRRVSVDPASIRMALATMFTIGAALFLIVFDLRVSSRGQREAPTPEILDSGTLQ